MKKKSFNFGQMISYFIVIVILLIIMLPIIMLFLYSTIPSGVLGVGKFSEIITSFTLEGYIQVFQQTDFLNMGWNSFFIATVLTLLQLVFSFFTAYALTRWSFKGRQIYLSFIIITMTIPFVSIMVPNYITINELGLLNNKWAVILPFIASGFAIFLMVQNFKEIPKSLIEAAQIDGCDERQLLLNVYLPLSKPSIASLAVILFVTHWNQYQWPLLVLSDPSAMTLPLSLVRFRNEGIIEWMPTAAACVMTLIVPIVIYIFAQKAFVKTNAETAIKG